MRTCLEAANQARHSDAFVSASLRQIPRCASTLTGEEPMDQNLADELVTMVAEDQRLLQQLFDSGELPSESYHPRMKALSGRVTKQPG